MTQFGYGPDPAAIEADRWEALLEMISRQAIVRGDPERGVLLMWNGSQTFQGVDATGRVVAFWTRDPADDGVHGGVPYEWASSILDDAIAGKSYADPGEPHADYTEVHAV